MRLDPVAVIEAAYATASDDASWLRGVLEALRPELDDGLGIVGFVVEASVGLELGEIVVEVGPAPRDWRAASRVLSRTLDGDSLRRVRECPVGALRGVLGRAVIGASASAPLREFWGRHGARDTVGLVIRDGTSRVVRIAALVRQKPALDRRTRWGLELRAAHIAAGLRLRRSSEAAPVAVVAPDGRVLHATLPAQHASVREALRRQAIAVDRARGPMRRRDPAGSIDLWKGLCAGEWSLVERFESDGRRYYLARANGPDVPGPPPLSARERQVLALAVIGQANKLIAYALGLSVWAVSAHLRAAATKLGVRTRIELVQLGAVMAAAAASYKK